MAWRPYGNLISGELDNCVPGKVTGTIFFFRRNKTPLKVNLYLDGDFHEVQADDFIYMAPYCPQFFYATGWVKGRYLIYKDVSRDYVDGL